MNILAFFCVICSFPTIESNYFYGGTVSWKPMDNSNWNSVIPIIFTQSYQWGETEGFCEQFSISDQSPKIPMNSDTLQCVTLPSSSCGNYTPVSISGYCTDYSILSDSSVSQIYDVENITMNSTFCVAYQGATWPAILSSICGSSCSMSTAKYSIGSCVNLVTRSDGFINTPPVTKMISPIRVPVDVSVDIGIPVMDADNDIINCRWARNTSMLDECGDICGILPGSQLNANSCTLTFDSTGTKVGDFYAVALMIEDFPNGISPIPLSSVSLQFLIYIIDKPICLFKPIISSIVFQKTIVEVGIPYHFTLTIVPGCSGMTIIDFFRLSPLNMLKSNIAFDSATNKSFVTEIWTPTKEQIGSQIYCAVATDNAHIQSEFYYLTFIVITNEDEIRKKRGVPNINGPVHGGGVGVGVGVNVATITAVGGGQVELSTSASSITSQFSSSDFTFETSTDITSDTGIQTQKKTVSTSSRSTLLNTTSSTSTTSTASTVTTSTATTSTSTTSTSSTATSTTSTTATSTTSTSSTSTTATSTTSTASTSSTSTSATSTTSTSSTSTSTTSTTSTSSTSTSATSTTSTSSTSTSTTSTTSSSSASTSSSSTSSTSSTSTTSTSSSTSASTSTATSTTSTTATTQEAGALIVTVPVPTRDNSGLIGLGLALGIPLLLSLTALAFYNCFRQQCMSLSRSLGGLFKSSEKMADHQMKPISMFNECKDDNPTFGGGLGDDYRNQYIKETSFTDHPMNILCLTPMNEQRPVSQDRSFASVSISEFELNNSNVTTTSLFSPSTNNLPNNHVQITNEKPSINSSANSKTSVLVRAYCQQEKNKSTNP